jgi:transcription initiation factor TFIID TATA-box-binding protein
MPCRRANFETSDVVRVSENEPTAEDIDRMLQEKGIVLKQGPTFSNIVAMANVGCQIDLKSIAIHLRNAEYNPKRFPAVSIRIRNPKTTALKSGKMVITGAKSIDDSKLACRKFIRMLQKLGYIVAKSIEECNFKIQNHVANMDFGHPIRLEGFEVNQRMFARWEPQIFPALIYNMMLPKLVSTSIAQPSY